MACLEDTQRRCVLPAHIYLCQVGKAAVLLDLKRNRYTGLAFHDAQELVALLQDPSIGSSSLPMGSTSDARSVPSRWLKSGLLQLAAPAPRWFTPPCEPARLASGEDLRASPATIRMRDIARFAHACLYARRSLRRRTLWDIACELHTVRVVESAASTHEPALIEAAARFRRLRPLTFTSREQCLLHALALKRFLSSCGLAATWMIGVRLHPWGAHSWVQSASLVLDADPESVHEYHPIIAV